MAAVETTDLNRISSAEYKKRIRSWVMYDWANSAFATTIMAAVLPAYYSAVAGANLSSAATATQYWSATNSVAVLIVAILSPVLGTISDIKRGKKKFLTFFVMVGVIGTGLMILINTGDWFMASLFFVLGRIGFGGANIFYDALLPHVAKEEDQDRVSTTGYAVGYLGGGLLLAINVAMIFALPDNNLGIRLSLFSVAIWWLVFSVPIFRNVPEPRSATKRLEPGESLMRVSFRRIADTLGSIREYRELFKFLIAFLIYNDGIGVIITVAVIYGTELGFGTIELTLAILLVQFVGIPYSLIFGNLPSRADKRQTMFTAFVIFNIIMLPLVGIASSRFLPQGLTGTPSPNFVSTDTAVGQGKYTVTDPAVELDGDWRVETVSAELLGEACVWYAFWCNDSERNIDYAFSDDAEARLNIAFNGQPVEIVYATGPESGIWAVAIDGVPLLEDEEPVTIDAYNATTRYGVKSAFQAETEGEHILSLINTGQSNTDSAGNALAISQIEVQPPLRTSNLGAILGILIGTQLIGLLFAFLLGPVLFKGVAARMDTKRAIMLALSAYFIIAVWGFFLNSVIEFWFLAWMVAVVQGGSQALSRSLYASMSPTALSGEFFGFFSIMSKFASFLSPLVFVASVAIWNSSRPGVLALVAFFGIGMFLLTRVNVEEGRRIAREKDTELLIDITD
ncbi:MAG: MFS transporter [Anaerolineae bacterium]|nr:MFS transporter [Anaerolineae bacterium]